MKKGDEKNILLASTIGILLVLVISFASYSSWTGMVIFSDETPTDYISYWTFDEDMTDIAGNIGGLCGHEIWTSTCPDLVEGKVGQAYNFDGLYDYIEMEYADFLDITNTISISAWIKTSSIGNSRKIVDKMKFGGSFKAGYRLDLGSDNKAGFVIGNNDVVSIKDTESIADGEWHHVVGIFNGSNLFLYRDGDLINSKTTDIGYIKINDLPLRVGVASDSLSNYFKGDIDEILIYNRALSSKEVSSIYNTQSQGISLIREVIEDDSALVVGSEISDDESPAPSGTIEPDSGEEIKDVGKDTLTMWVVIGLLLILIIVILLKKWPFEKSSKKKRNKKNGKRRTNNK